MGSPQIQESILDRASPQQRQSVPINNQSPALSQTSPEMPRWMGESTALYNMNQGLAVSCLNLFNSPMLKTYFLL